MAERKYWFKSKRYGWGWTPCSWQGWLVTIAAMTVIIMIGVNVDRYSHSASDTVIGMVLPVFGITLLLIFIAWLTGEKPRWRWGDDD